MAFPTRPGAGYLVRILTGVTLCAAMPALQAQPPGAVPPGPLPLERLDENGDGRVSREEFSIDDRAPGMRLLGRADADGDGAITQTEMQAAIEAMAEDQRQRAAARMQQRFDALDEDGDGAIRRSDVLDQAFDRLDADGDGFITEAEARSAHERRSPRRGPRRSAREPGAGAGIQSDGLGGRDPGSANGAEGQP